MPHRSLVGWVYHDRRESGPEGCFLCQTFFSSKRASSTAKRIFQTFKSPALFLANAACGAEREGRGSRFSWLTRWRPSVAEPGAHALAWLLALARHRHRSASVGRRPHGYSTRLAACLLGRDQCGAAVAPHEQRWWQWLRPALRQATGSPPVAGTVGSVLRHPIPATRRIQQ